MQAVKNMAATVKHKAENASAVAEEKKDVTKVAAEEKVEKMKAQDGAGKKEATERRVEKEGAVEKVKEEKLSQNAAEKESVVHPGPIGKKPTPADLDMPVENPTSPTMGYTKGTATGTPFAPMNATAGGAVA